MVLNKKKLITIFNEINLPCRDDGKKFTDFRKITRIKTLLKQFVCEEGNLYRFFYRNKSTNLILATHIDCVYNKTYCKTTKKGFFATLDNSLTNAIAIYCVIKYPKVFKNVGILFTGNEEDESKGAREFSQKLNDECFVLNMDVTCGSTSCPRFENALSALNKNFWNYLEKKEKNFFIDSSFSDDDYREFAKATNNTISYCIPILPKNESKNWMHDDEGQFVEYVAIKKYIKVLISTIRHLEKYFLK